MGRKIGGQLKNMLALNESAERLALAFSFGVFLTLTPLVGLHTPLALGLAFLFGLNRVAVLFGLLLNNPWTLIPYYSFSTYVGGHLIGFPENFAFPEFSLSLLWNGGFWSQIAQQWRILLPMALGSTILAVVIGALSYPAAVFAIRRGRAALAHP
jgi:hypothetical protein